MAFKLNVHKTINKKMQNFHKLTVLLPVYNPKPEWLSLSISSILNQTYKSFSLVIIDDGSNEQTQNLLETFKRRDDRIYIIRNPKNLGLIKSLNIGLKSTSSEFIARMDADDWCYPERLELQLGYLENHPEISVLATNAIWMDTRKQIFKEQITQHEDIVATLPFYCCIVHPSVMFRRQEIIDIGGYPEVYGAEDYALWAKICYVTNLKMAILPRICLQYRRGNNTVKYQGKQDVSSQKVKRFIFNSIASEFPINTTNSFSSTDNRELTLTDIKLLYNFLNKKKDINHKLLRLNSLRSSKNYLKKTKTHNFIVFFKQKISYVFIKAKLFFMTGKI